jgi:mono/diheme cytochrome c family protein
MTLLALAGGLFHAAAQTTNPAAAKPVPAPDYSHSNDFLAGGLLAWDAEQKSAEATNDQIVAILDFSFTNISSSPITLIDARGSCSCTTIELRQKPWLLQAGESGQLRVIINLAGKKGILFKTATIVTDKGFKNLLLRVNIQPPPPLPSLTEEERARGVTASKVDRQAVFRGECASCHVRNVEGKYGPELFTALCAVCHEASPRATMVPDLHNLNVPTSEEFWRTWITSGKAGTLMPAFDSAQGGPLTQMQISSLATHLNTKIPSQVPVPAQ